MPRNRRRNKRRLEETEEGAAGAERPPPPSGSAAKAPRFGASASSSSSPSARKVAENPERRRGSSSSSDSDSSSDDDSGDSDTDERDLAAVERTMICNYKTIPVNVRFIDTSTDRPLSEATGDHRTNIYLRVHQSKGGTQDDAHKSAIFVTNFTSMATTSDIANLFGNVLGVGVKSVVFGGLAGKVAGLGDSWASGKVVLRYALVTLGSSADVKCVMGWVGPQPLEWEIPAGSHSDEGGRPRNSMEGWMHHHKSLQPTIDSAQEDADRHMEEFMARRETLKKQLDARRMAPDEDGFQLVKRKHTARSSGNTRASNRKSRRRKKKGGGKELHDFYRFQLRETKRNKLAELRERFAEDKKRVEALRAKKKFKLASSR